MGCRYNVRGVIWKCYQEHGMLGNAFKYCEDKTQKAIVAC